MATASVVNRRDFLKKSAAGGTALVIGFYLPAGAHAQEASQQEKKPPNPLNAWVRITPDNRVTLILGKSEMGQGIMTALPMILAEELYLDWKNVRIEQAPTDPKIYDHGTGGSGSVSGSWLPMRQAGAAAREMLVSAAAARWNVNPNTCVAKDGGVLHGARKNFLTYGELVEDAAKLPVPDFKTVPLKNSDTFTIVGHDTRRFEARDKATGTAKFGIDSRMPGMQFAVIARCPVFGGKLKSFDAAKAKTVAGVKDVIAIDPVGPGAFTAGGVVVLADNSWAAMQGRKAMQITWDEGPAASESTDSLRKQFLDNAAKPGKVVRNDGDADAAFSAATKKVEATYEFPFACHATMEPMNCTVRFKDGVATVWAPTQAAGFAAAAVAKALGLKEAKVDVKVPYLGGGFGRRYMTDVIVQAAQLARETEGAPVQLLWPREQDMAHDYYRPAYVCRCKAGFDSKGGLLAWTSISAGSSMGAPAFLDNTTDGASNTAYGFANARIAHQAVESPVPTGIWRSVAHSQNAFFTESFIDECAAAAGRDPVAFRAQLLKESERHLRVLARTAELARWGTPLDASGGAQRARGIAVHRSFGSIVGQVAEVSLDQDKRIRVHRVVCVVDCGVPVNPNLIRQQMESGIVFGLSAALHGEITIEQGEVQQSNFHDYTPLRFAECPAIEVDILPGGDTPGGVGEPGTPPIAPAVANAVYALTGVRLRSLPLRIT
jgi:isoquinoline 1-oxidoreductase beta subunit